MNIPARNLLVDIIKYPYAWPGGYERLLVLEDGALLCSKCARKEASRIMSDIRDGYDTGWMPAATCYEAGSVDCTAPDDQNQCDHCYKRLGELC